MLTNERGQRVLDTQIRLVNPSPSQNRQQAQHLLKQGQNLDPPDVETVRKLVIHLLRGRRVVGYHVPQKLKELNIHAEVNAASASFISLSDSPHHCEADEKSPLLKDLPYNGQIFDCAYQFTNLSVGGLDEGVAASASPLKGVQTQMPFDAACQRFLGLKWRKRKNQMNAFIESKITMALYQRWRSLKGLPATMALCSTDALHSVTPAEALLTPFGSQITVVPEEKPKSHIPVAVTNHLANQ